MKSSQYIQLFGTTPKVIALDNNVVAFQVSIRAPVGVTVELAVEYPGDFVQGSSYDARVAPAGAALTWVAPPNAVNANGVLHITDTPYAAVRLTPTADAVVTILQQGLR